MLLLACLALTATAASAAAQPLVAQLASALEAALTPTITHNGKTLRCPARVHFAVVRRNALLRIIRIASQTADARCR